MESVQDRPRSRHRHRHTERETDDSVPEQGKSVPESNELHDDHGQNDEIVKTNKLVINNKVKKLNESDKRKLNRLNTLLSEQEEVFKNEQDGVEMKKQATKERVTNLFEQFREILAEKETELLDKIDSEYTTAERFIADFVSNIESEKHKVGELLSSDRLSPTVGQDLDIEEVEEEIDTSLEIRNDILNQFQIPYFVLNEHSVSAVKDLSFGEFQESITDQNEQEESVADNEAVPGNSEDTGYDVNIENNSIAAELNTSNENGETDYGGIALAEGSVNEPELCNEKESEAGGAARISGDESRTPTAPPIEPEESPPPYWQAMGLERPHEDAQSPAEIPGYYDIPHSPNNRLPDNKLELWHSFPIRRQYDRRGPMPVSLTWNHGRICLVDRANMRVKFFFPNGQQITEIYFNGKELQDLTFLEEANGESRYALTIPKSKALLIIGIDSQNSPKVIRKLSFGHQYSCICRGPKLQTLLGAEVATKFVHMFTFSGQILLSIGQTPSFGFLQYIKRIEVFGNNIIFLDWKINSVSIFQDDGMAVGEYCGTQSSPLVNPLDMTLDKKGNIMILNGEFSNVHVIDLQCNLVEIIKIPRNVSSSSSNSKLIAFDTESQKLSVARSNGDLAIFSFENGYDCLPQRKLATVSVPNIVSPHSSGSSRQRAPEVLPLVEGMLPSTIENIIMHQQSRNRNRQFHL